MLKGSTFPFDVVFYLSSSFITRQKSILNIVWKSDFWGSPLFLDLIFLYVIYCTKLPIDMKQAAERFSSWDQERESIFPKPLGRGEGGCHSLIAGRLWVAVAKCPSREPVGEGFLQQAKSFYWVRKRR